MACPQALVPERFRQRRESLKAIQAYLLQNGKWQFFVSAAPNHLLSSAWGHGLAENHVAKAT
jgi:hypothetical protein